MNNLRFIIRVLNVSVPWAWLQIDRVLESLFISYLFPVLVHFFSISSCLFSRLKMNKGSSVDKKIQIGRELPESPCCRREFRFQGIGEYDVAAIWCWFINILFSGFVQFELSLVKENIHSLSKWLEWQSLLLRGICYGGVTDRVNMIEVIQTFFCFYALHYLIYETLRNPAYFHFTKTSLVFSGLVERNETY